MEKKEVSQNLPEEKALDSNAKLKAEPVKMIGFFEMYKYGTIGQKLLVILAIILSLGHGIMLPFFSVIFGNITEDFAPDKGAADIENVAMTQVKLLFLVSGLALGLAGVSYAILKIVSARITEKLRKAYFKKILESEISWFDKENAEKLTTRYSEEFSSFANGSGASVQIFFFALATALGGIGIGFVIGYLYTIYMFLTLPILFIGMGSFISMF